MKKNTFHWQTRFSMILLAFLCTFLWGSAFPFIKIGYHAFHVEGAFSQIIFAGWRFTLAGVLVLFLQTIRTKAFSLPPRGSRLSVFQLGLVMTGGQYLLFYLGLANATGVRASVMQGTGTFLTVVLAHFCFGGTDRLTANRIAGCLVGLFGVILVNLDRTGGAFHLRGEGLLFLATALFSVGSLMSKQVTCTVDPFCATGWQLLIGGVTLLVVGMVGGGILIPSGPAAWGILFYLSALSSIAFTIWTVLLQRHPAGQIAVFNFLTPVFGVLLSAMLLGETLSGWKTTVALLLVCAGILLVNRQGFPSFFPRRRIQ